MSKLRIEGDLAAFYCPGCEELHHFRIRGADPWEFDGNMEAPTFAPSLRYGPSWQMPKGWDPDKAPKNPDGTYQVRPDGKKARFFAKKKETV